MSFTPSEYGQGCLVTIGASVVTGGPHTHFPLLLSSDNSGFPSSMLTPGATAALNGGGDIRVSTDIDGVNELAVEVRRCVVDGTPSNRVFVIWVGYDGLDNNDTLYVFWNKAGATLPAFTATYGRNAVWTNAGYEAVSHDLITDSTGNYDNAFSIVGNPVTTIGPFGDGAYDFDGAGDRIKYDVNGRNPMSGLVTGSLITVEAIMKSDSTNTNNRGVHIAGASTGNVQIGQNAGTSYNFYVAATSAFINKRARRNSAGDELNWTVIAGNMKLSNSNAVLVEDGDIFIDGDASATGNDSGTNFGAGTNKNSIEFGERNDGVGDFFGAICEMRFTHNQRTSGWNTTTAECIINRSTFCTWGTPFVPGGGGPSHRMQVGDDVVLECKFAGADGILVDVDIQVNGVIVSP